MFYIILVKKVGLVAQFEQFKYLQWYDYCGKPKHTRETFWKIHKKPIRGRERKTSGPTRAQEN